MRAETPESSSSDVRIDDEKQSLGEGNDGADKEIICPPAPADVNEVKDNFEGTEAASMAEAEARAKEKAERRERRREEKRERKRLRIEAE